LFFGQSVLQVYGNFLRLAVLPDSEPVVLPQRLLITALSKKVVAATLIGRLLVAVLKQVGVLITLGFQLNLLGLIEVCKL
jgi:hypothetical protein